MRTRDKIYMVLVNRVPGIRDRYRRKRSQVNGVGRIIAWVYLFALNIAYYVLCDPKLKVSEKCPYYEEKVLYSKGSESSLSYKMSPESYADKLEKYEVVSFDVFDTLIFRPFSAPTDLFYILGHRLNYPDYKRIREEMEWKARLKQYKKEKHYEVNLNDIYTMLSEETGIDRDEAMQLETELETEFCFANPYMKQVVEKLQKMGKRVIITSDMYLNTEQIKKLLKNCGYAEFDACYVSCDIKRSKNKGDLYKYVKEKEGMAKTYAHVGDNYISDVEQARKQGFSPFHYVNVNAAGEQYRAYDMSVITGGVYRGIVNAHIHNGLHKYSREYEYGYIFGGLFVAGYCQFIHEYVEHYNIDKILFLARDGDVLSKAYRIMYPQETYKQEYVYWSRLAALKLSAGYYRYDYFRRFLYHKVNQKYTLKQVFASMEVEFLLEEVCKKYQFDPDTELTDKNVEKVKSYLIRNWELVLSQYKEQVKAGKQYYKKILRGSQKAVAVDIGWAGSGAISLDYVVNKVWKLNCEIVGIIAGTNTCHNAEPDMTESYLQSGRLVSYLYSQRENRDIWKLHDAGKDHNLYWELLLDAPTGSFKGFYPDEANGYVCRFKESKADIHKIEEIQKGILDFVEEYDRVQKKLGNLGRISGRDAYAPMVNVENGMNREFMKRLAQQMDDVNVG